VQAVQAELALVGEAARSGQPYQQTCSGAFRLDREYRKASDGGDANAGKKPWWKFWQG
jgi:hypothetical protein